MKQTLPKLTLTLTLALFSIISFSQVIINEYSVSNLTGYLDNHEKAEDWIELYNTSGTSVSLSGYFLSDDNTNPTKWEIPSGINIPANGYVTFWTSGRDAIQGIYYHTNFKLKQTKNTPEHVVFSDPSGTIINDFQLELTQLEHSRGRQPNGSDTWAIFTSPTKGIYNSGPNFTAYAQAPIMSIEAGFYNGSVSVELSTEEPNSTMRYTTDGKRPTTSSPVYSNAISINSTTILKATCFSNDNQVLPSLITFNTYFINVEHDLPILSTSSNTLKPMLNGNASLKPHGTIEYFKDGERLDYGYGEYNKHGQDSWQFPHRSFDYIARDEMGYHAAIEEKLMELSDRDSYQRIIIRASGDDNYPGIDTSAHIRDVFIQKLANKNNMNLDMRRGERCVVYVDGDFWGVYSIREKVSDADYTKYYYNQDKYNINYLMLWGGTWAEYGGDAAFTDWNQVKNYILNNNMANQGNYETVKEQYDVTSLVDYVLINSYVVCTDWINWNVGWWRGLDPDGQHKKWGYILWDEDATFNHYINYTNVPDETPNAPPCYPEGITADPGKHIEILNKLLENEEFTQYYVSRYQDLLNTAFVKDDMIGLLESIENQMTNDMSFQIARWGGNFTTWQQNVQKVKNFITQRDLVMPEGLNDCYNLTGPYEITMSVEPAGTGGIKFNSLELSDGDFPFTGVYHGGMEMKMKAIESNLGYTFDHWELNNHTVSPGDDILNVTLSLTQGDEITAVFSPTGNPSVNIVINEINYKSTDDFDPGDWVELYNKGDEDVDVSNWVFKDSDDAHQFIIPDGTIMPGNSYLVLAKSKSDLEDLFPDAAPVLGDLSFGLSGAGELIRLFNDAEVIIDELIYGDDSPWPSEPDGDGPTLELTNPEFDNALASSWHASYLPDAPHGTPTALNSTDDVGINDIVYNQLSLKIYPNPMRDGAYIEIEGNTSIPNGILRIYNLQGKVIRSEQLNATRTFIRKDNLSPGIYICKVFEDDVLLGAQKLIIK